MDYTYVTVEVKPEIEVKDYKGVELEYVTPIDEEEIETIISSQLKYRLFSRTLRIALWATRTW